MFARPLGLALKVITRKYRASHEQAYCNISQRLKRYNDAHGKHRYP